MYWQIGPEKGVMHLAVAAIVNALWDLWARLENKPLWRLLADMDPEVSISHNYLSLARHILAAFRYAHRLYQISSR